jgi:hypothetical protein
MKLDLEMEGYQPGSPQFEAQLRSKQVLMCQEMQGVPSCDACPAFDNCEIIKAHLRDIRFGVEIKDGPDGRT